MNASNAPQLFQLRRPQAPLPKSDLPNLRGLTREELREWLARVAQGPSYRADQIFAWIHRQGAIDFSGMSNLPESLRQSLQAAAELHPLRVDVVQRSSDGTQKLRLATVDGHAIESVLIPNDERGYTQCISSQVGCAMDCRFCATASLSFVRNLESWEIVDQVARARSLLTQQAHDEKLPYVGRITNLVYMGMGEPLHNYNQVKRSLAILMDDGGEPISGRRITVSTSGLVPAIERFGKEGLGREVGLAISLNATTDDVRNQVMPVNTRWPIAELLAAIREVPKERRVTFEYVLLADVNDSDADARRLTKLLRGFDCHVNVIPFNPHPHAPYRRPSTTRVQRFVSALRESGLKCYVRTPRGDDIAAACGQLALENGNAPRDAGLECETTVS